jgi:hypothetical protein
MWLRHRQTIGSGWDLDVRVPTGLLETGELGANEAAAHAVHNDPGAVAGEVMR